MHPEMAIEIEQALVAACCGNHGGSITRPGNRNRWTGLEVQRVAVRRDHAKPVDSTAQKHYDKTFAPAGRSGRTGDCARRPGVMTERHQRTRRNQDCAPDEIPPAYR